MNRLSPKSRRKSPGTKRSFRLKTMLALVLMLCVVCGLVKVSINRSVHRNAVENEIRRLGGHVVYDAAKWQRRVPDWVITLYHGNPAIFPVAIESPFGEFSEEDETLDDARSFFSQVSDSDLVTIAELKTLKRVDLTGTKVTQEGRDWLSRLMPNCEITMP